MKELILLLPEIFLVVTIAGVIGGEIGQSGEKVRLTTATALAGLAGAFVQTLLAYRYGATMAVGRVVSIDGFALFFKLLAILLAALSVGTSARTREIARERRAEFCALIIASALAMSFAAAAADLLLAFLSLQLLNVLGYFLSAHGNRSERSAEAAVKHLAFGAVAGVLMLYGIGILFAHTHSLNIYDMHRALVTTPLSRESAAVVFILVFMSLAFQFAAFPMHLWAPDVIEGAPTPASAFVALSSRIAGFAVAIRFFIVVFAQPMAPEGQWQVLGGLDWPRLVAIVSGLTMLAGSLLAFRQVGAKRLVASLIVAESGFLLMGLLVLDEIGVAAVLYNLVVELFAIMGVFYVLAFLVDELGSDRLSSLRGMLGRAIPESIFLILSLACLVGLPPFPGFIGKFALIGAAVRHQWHVLAIVALLSMVIATVAIARLAFSLIGDPKHVPSASAIGYERVRHVHLGILFIPMVLVGIFAEFVLNWAGQSLHFVLW